MRDVLYFGIVASVVANGWKWKLKLHQQKSVEGWKFTSEAISALVKSLVDIVRGLENWNEPREKKRATRDNRDVDTVDQQP